MRIDVDSVDDLVVWNYRDTRISLFLLDSFHWSYTVTYPDLLKACMSREANILCSSLLDDIGRVSIYRINPQITTHFHISLPHNLQEFHGIALFPVWWGPAFQRREKLTFLQAPRAKAYDSRFSQLLDHDDVRFPSVGIPRLQLDFEYCLLGSYTSLFVDIVGICVIAIPV